MSLLQLIADIPTNANLRIKVAELEKEVATLRAENSELKSKVAAIDKPKNVYSRPVQRVG